MSRNSNSSLEQLTFAFNQLRASDKTEENSAAVDESRDSREEVSNLTEETHENTRVLRSGSQHCRLPPASLTQTNLSVTVLTTSTTTMSTYTTTTTTNTSPNTSSPPGSPNPNSSHHYKIINMQSNIPEFTGTDPNYTADEYVALCEAMMGQCSIMQDADKISCLRARLRPGSAASHQMQSGAFRKPQESKDYATFRRNFLREFGTNIGNNILASVAAAADAVFAEGHSLDLRQVQVKSYNVAKDFVQSLLHNGWFQGGTLTEENASRFLELLMGMIFLQARLRKSSLALTYQPTEEFSDFVARLRIRLGETDSLTPSSTVAAVSNTDDETASPTYAAMAVSGKPIYTCTYCQREGHTFARCYIRIRDSKKAQKNKSSVSGEVSRPPRQKETGAVRRPAKAGNAPASHTAPPSQRGSSGDGRYCSVHNSTTHSTDDCYSVVKLRNDVSRGYGKSSGEAARPAKQKPG